VTEIYGNWPAIKALVDSGAVRTPLLRELYVELQRREAGFKGFTAEVFRKMTGYTGTLKDNPLYLPFVRLTRTLQHQGKLKHIDTQSSSHVYEVTAENRLPEEHPSVTNISATKKPKTWHDHAMKAIRDLKPTEFENVVAAWAKAVHRFEPEVTKRSADGGFDVLVRYPHDTNVHIEVKLWNTAKVGAREVRSLRGSLRPHDIGIVVAPGGFTASALTEAQEKGKAKVKLVDADELLDDMKKHRLGLKVEMVEQVTVDHDWFQYFKEQRKRTSDEDADPRHN